VETVFISKLKPLFDAVDKEMDLYAPKSTGDYYTFVKYDPSEAIEPEFNNIRITPSAKEFLFPMCELAAVFPNPASPQDIKPFAVSGLKDCDLRAIKVLDCVFKEDEFLDPSYVARREKMFIISGDCHNPADTCFCNLVGGWPFCEEGFDLNLSKIKGGFIIQAGSEKGRQFIKQHDQLFANSVSDAAAERDENRKETQKHLDDINAEYKLGAPIKEIMERSLDSEIFDVEAKDCVECQGCTRVCPTCHCFFLYDTKQQDYFGKMKMWDSCMRLDYTTVAGGENPRKILGDRLRHRLMHKFVYFLDRYGIEMCIGCGRCITGCAGEIEIRKVIKKLNDQLKHEKQTEAVK
jgi:sulfhydrogenase subunit beta (sulfur reductase)